MVLGGLAGLALAQDLAGGGQRVTIFEPDPDDLLRLRAFASDSVAISADPQAVALADLVIFAGPIKAEAFDLLAHRTIAAVVAGHAPPTLPSGIAGRDRVIALGLKDGVLMEICPFAETATETVATGLALAGALGRTALVTAGPVSLVAFLRARLMQAADRVFLLGSTPWEVDEAWRSLGASEGPFEAEDRRGLDMSLPHRGPTGTPVQMRNPLAARMAELGKLGRATGAGWYRYPGDAQVDDPIVADLALEEAHFLRITRSDFRAEEIVERLMLALVNAVADALGQGIATGAAELELAAVEGLGLPRSLGGLLYHADRTGLAEIVARLDALSHEDPLWAPLPVLREAARTGRPLSALR